MSLYFSFSRAKFRNTELGLRVARIIFHKLVRITLRSDVNTTRQTRVTLVIYISAAAVESQHHLWCQQST